MAVGPFLLYSAAGTIIWTAALAYAGVVLRANFALVHDCIGIVTNVLLATLGVLLVRRYVRWWTANH